MKCERCGKNISDDSIFCSECGVKIEQTPLVEEYPETEKLVPEQPNPVIEEIKTAEKYEEHQQAAPYQPVVQQMPTEKKSSKKGWVLAIAIAFPVLMIVAIVAVLFLQNTDMLHVSKNYEEYQYEYDLVDFSALAAKLEYYDGEIGETYTYDGDDNGRNELYVTVKDDTYSMDPVKFVFETMDDAEIDISDSIDADEEDIIEAGNASLYKLRSNYFALPDYKECVEGYEDHLDSVLKGEYFVTEEDVDSDGKDEYVFLIPNFEKNWTETIGKDNTSRRLESAFIKNFNNPGMSIVYVDGNENGVVFHSFYTESFTDTSDTYSFSWENGNLTIENIYTSTTTHYFCTDINNSKDSKGTNSQITSTIVELYTYFLKETEYENVLVRQADICDAPGEEFICICSDGYSWKFFACAIWNGRVIILFEQDYSYNQAIYLTSKGSKGHLLNYIQLETGDYYSYQGYGTEYKFWCTRFDENYVKVDDLVRSVTTYGGVSSDAEGFFSELYGYINNAIVCIDRYELMGYSIIPDKYVDYGENNEAKYLAISNYDINKVGIVRVETYLHLREGPSVGYNLIRLNPNNRNSVIMQQNGSPVTIIDTVNTMDRENPIWVKIQIKYSNRTFVGYSSQRYIDIANITHIRAGGTFKIIASTNDSGLRWYSNDSSVLQIDPYTGLATGIRSGLVLVTVESDSGLTDSCLIMVD